jgi:drug/metabolite transporter (DMT)-like permease
VLVIVLAVLSAVGFGIGMALQQRGARVVDFEHALKPSLLRHLLVRRVWLIGMAVSGVGFLFQLLALRDGSVVTVQPIVTSALVVCLAVTAWLDREPLPARSWASIAAVVGGVAVFIEASSAHHAKSDVVAVAPLLVVSAAFATLVLVCGHQAHARPGLMRTVLVGLAAGLGNAYVAVLARAGGDKLHEGIGAVLRSPYPYAVVVVSGVCVFLVQAIYQAGRPTVSLPTATLVESLGSVVLAIVTLHEHPRLGGLRGGVALLALVVALAALVDLSREEAVLVTADAHR